MIQLNFLGMCTFFCSRSSETHIQVFRGKVSNKTTPNCWSHIRTPQPDPDPELALLPIWVYFRVEPEWLLEEGHDPVLRSSLSGCSLGAFYP